MTNTTSAEEDNNRLRDQLSLEIICSPHLSSIGSSPAPSANHAFLCLDVANHTISPQMVDVSSISISTDNKESANNSRVSHFTSPHVPNDELISSDISQHLNIDNQPFDQQNLDSSINIPYLDLGDCTFECEHCGSLFWYNERLKSHNRRRRIDYHLCCGGGRIYMHPTPSPPPFIQQLLSNNHFMDHIRAYNQMFSMTSFGAKVDESINKGRGPYVFKVTGQIYHWIGSFLPENGNSPRFLQLYIYDTHNEVRNRLRNFDNDLNSEIVEGLIRVLDEHSGLVKLFRTARDRCNETDIPEFKIRLYNKGGVRGYELPTSDSLGTIVFEDGPHSQTDFDVIIEARGGFPQRINKLHQSYMSLQFPLLFIFGEPGFYPGLTLKPRNSKDRGKKVSMNEYYRYQLHPRVNEFGLLFKCGRLFQQYVVTVFCAIEQCRLDHVRKRQRELRTDYLMGLYDAVSRGDRHGIEAGSMIMLPRTFTGGPRYMYSHYLDALAICRSIGNPQYFITFTCNVKWPEIQRYMKQYPNLTPADRADVVCRIFQQKVNDFIHFLKDAKPFGDVVGSYKVVTQLMLHGPCGAANPNASCTENGVCTKNFPKKYNNTTFIDKDGYTHYRRRESKIYFMKGDARLDNCDVVPYNRSLCLAFQAHINVEYCGWSMLIKYLFKYISKGPDRIMASVNSSQQSNSDSSSSQTVQIDEIQNYIDGRFVCPFEACWRIFDYPIHRREPAVQILNVHLENMQKLTFHENDNLRKIIKMDSKTKTTLTEWYAYNEKNTDGRHLTYVDFPSEFVWYPESREWRRRTLKTKKSIGRLTYVHPSSGDLFYFRMLLAHKKGCTSPTDVRTVNNHIYPTYRDACKALGLLADDNEWHVALEEAALSASASQIRTLFAQLLVFCEVSNPLELWTKHWELMKDDIPMKVSHETGIPNYNVNTPELQDRILYELEIILSGYGKSVKDFGLPPISTSFLKDLQNKLLMEEKNYNRDVLMQEISELLPKLNAEQHAIYDRIIKAVEQKKQELLFVYGHGGTGKTFLWKVLTSSLRSKGKIVLAVASSGIASLLLPGGRTAHSRFKLPLELTDESICHATKHSQLGDLLVQTELILWDEAPMNDKRCFEALDRTLRDLMNQPEVLFGGKTVILGGDFRQTLPVKKGATKQELIHTSIAQSYLWNAFTICTLTENMRLLQSSLTSDQRRQTEEFAKWLLDICDGKIGDKDEMDDEDTRWITIPDQYCLPDTKEGLVNLINFIYDSDTLASPTANTFQQKAIVCPTNDTADIVNKIFLESVAGPSRSYLSRNEAIPLGRETSEAELLYPPEYLNTLSFPGFPPHELELKVGTPIMLLRNVNLAGGLCNVTGPE